MSEHEPEFSLQCPLPIREYPNVTLAHGGGGRLTRDLIGKVFHAAFGNEFLAEGHDGARVPGAGPLALTTDAFVVRPLEFPGGDIGRLAVYGTANDLAMCAAEPAWLSAAFILEEGLPMATLWRIACGMREAAKLAGVQIVAGDTKVVDRGKGDGIYIATSGAGIPRQDPGPSPRRARPGDAILLSGDLGRHAIAVMAVREGLAFETALESDCAPLWPAVRRLIEAGVELHVLRDLTRGGLTAGLNEIAETAGLRLEVDESAIPVRDEVRGACELLGLDPNYAANEGRFIACVPEAQAERALEALRAEPVSAGALRIGRVAGTGRGRVDLLTRLGARRVLDLPNGEQLPRIC
ncbi:MAG: hydrogenase expression/formation protein HypE [Planctomycetota bacterium]|nr:hydrogenase expression/formation protein HypE [Planctomycetota bacterium]